MNDLGWTLGWLTVQVAILLLPAIGLHALASRRGPASAAWVATVSLAMVVILGVLALVPLPSGQGGEAKARVQLSPILAPDPSAKPDPTASAIPDARVRGAEARSRAFAGLRLAWSGIERRAAGPVARFRAWGRIWAVALLAGSAFGLIRLSVGLWAVRLCRRRGRTVDDPALIGLVEELGRAMGCDRPVQIREVFDLTTPATAGWLRPMLLLPGDWRGWDEAERRAVVAHELAHVIRGDYAAGLVARLAEIMNPFHPMVRWMAGRLQLEQELAADAMGAKFAGGRSGYLRALARLALEQRERPGTWPARAFLPARGTLIRRIAMLNDKEFKDANGRAWSAAGRRAAVFGLLTLTVGVASWKAPVKAQEFKPGAASIPGEATTGEPTEPAPAVEPFEVRYIPETMEGIVAFRPAAIGRRLGTAGLNAFIRGMMADDFASIIKALKIDPKQPGFRKLGCEDIESVAVGVSFDSMPGVNPKPPKDAEGKPLHRIMFSGFTARAAAPFDWLAFLRQWKLEVKEVRDARKPYYTLVWPDRPILPFAFFLPDDRTLVIDEVRSIKTLANREVQEAPAYLRGADWERVNRGLVAVALNNKDDSFSKTYDLSRPDDAFVLVLFNGVDRWTLGVADRDEIAFRAEVTARDPSAAETIARLMIADFKLGRAALDALPPSEGMKGQAIRLGQQFLAKLAVKADGPSASAIADGFGTLADVYAIIKADLEEEMRQAKAEQAKANPKTEKR